MDISGDGSSLDVYYSLKTGTWTGEDSMGDSDGLGHSSGEEDGSTDTDEDDCEIWFNIQQNDYDGDGLTWWEEVNVYGTDPTNWDTDGDGLSDGLEDFDGDFLLNVEEQLWQYDSWDVDAAGYRAIGIAARMVTGNHVVIRETKTEWITFHVWTEVWLETPPSGSDHWYVFDSTDKYISGGYGWGDGIIYQRDTYLSGLADVRTLSSTGDIVSLKEIYVSW